jgi:peptide/nickel transport system substrate-binding protein
MYVSRRLAAARMGVIVVLTALAAAACGSSSSNGTGDSSVSSVPKSIYIVIDQPVNDMDPIVSNSAPVNQIVGATLDQVGTNGSIQPDLAASWSANSNATQWTYKLRPNLKFSNGTALTSADVVFTFDTVAADAQSTQNVYVQTVKHVAAEGPSTVVFTMKAPDATWPSESSNIQIVPKAYYNPKTFQSKPIGAGPYKVVSFNGTDTVTVTANPYYYGPKPAIKNATIQYVANETTRLDGLESGQYDAALLSGNNVNVAKAAGMTTKEITGALVVYLGYGLSTGPLANLKLRQAINLAVNRDALVKSILLGQGEPVEQLVSPTTFGYIKNYPVPAQNLAQAKQLVKESGYKGEQITMQYPTAYLPSPADLAQAVAGEMTQIGLNIKLVPMNSNTFVNNWFTKKLGSTMYLFSIQTETMDSADTFLDLDIYVSTTKDPTLPNLYNKMEATPNPAQRLQVMAEENAYRNAHQYYTPLFVQNFVYVYNKKYTLPEAPVDGYMNPDLFN